MFQGSCDECEAQFNDKSVKKIFGCARCGKLVCEFHCGEFYINEQQKFHGRGHRCIAKEHSFSFDNKVLFMTEEERQKYEQNLNEQRRINAMNGKGYFTDEDLRLKSLFEESQKSHNVLIDVSVITSENIFKLDFFVPKKMYAEEKYREKLNKARNLKEVDRLVKNYKKYVEGSQKKHWW